jgi:hypothetical protein
MANVSFPDAERLAEALGFTLDGRPVATTSTGILT